MPDDIGLRGRVNTRALEIFGRFRPPSVRPERQTIAVTKRRSALAFPLYEIGKLFSFRRARTVGASKKGRFGRYEIGPVRLTKDDAHEATIRSAPLT
jgi:hypothetical protein